jgi:hypothetical protein
MKVPVMISLVNVVLWFQRKSQYHTTDGDGMKHESQKDQLLLMHRQLLPQPNGRRRGKKYLGDDLKVVQCHKLNPNAAKITSFVFVRYQTFTLNHFKKELQINILKMILGYS